MGDHSMEPLGSPDLSPSGEEHDDDNIGPLDHHWHAQDHHATGSKPTSPGPDTPSSDQPERSSVPMQKRRRVTRACDECRRKKIKCDGKQPCTHCTVYSYECTYDQPSNRRRNPVPQQFEALEHRLQKAEAILRTVLPNLDLDDPRYDARGIDQIIESAKGVSAVKAVPSTVRTDSDDAQLNAMVENTGSLDLDDQGHWDYHGHSSGYTFMRKLQAQFGDLVVPDPRFPASNRARALSQLIESPKSASSSPYDLGHTTDLPTREIAKELCRNALDDACCLMRFIHQPSFYTKFDALYKTDPDNFTHNDLRFLPLLYMVMALGCLFARSENTILDIKGYEGAFEQSYQYFQAARSMLDITDCRDITTLQTICFMIVFLQSTAKLSTCYSYIGLALRACCRLGLHRNFTANFNPVEQEERKRVFWLIRKMDAYVGALLGLPQMLSDEDIDQTFPLELDDEYITTQGIRPMPPDQFPLIKASNAHTKLTCILKKVVSMIYPIKGANQLHVDGGYAISHGRIREIERELQAWMDALPVELRPSNDASRELARVQQLLRISYAHVQMMMYRPFLHYVSQCCSHKTADTRSYACAAACVSVARNIVHITTEMKKQGLLIGAYWFVMYTTYFAILSLAFFVVENPESPTGTEILRDAMEGRDTLASLAKRSLAADRCTLSLAGLFTELPEKLKERKNSGQSMTSSKKRSADKVGEVNSSQAANWSTPQSIKSGSENGSLQKPSRSSTFPDEVTGRSSKRNSMPDPSRNNAMADDPSLLIRPHHHSLWNLGTESGPLTPESSSTPIRAQPNSPAAGKFGQQLSNNPTLPDLKNVMFPSDNPFAYPNQPISTLEDAQFMPLEQHSGMGPFYNLPDQSQNSSFSNLSLPMYGGGLGQSYQQGGQGPSAMDGTNSATGFQMPDMPGAGDLSGGGIPVPEEGYWQQMDKSGGRTGLTPGGVNLDELFGWNGVWADPAYGRQ